MIAGPLFGSAVLMLRRAGAIFTRPARHREIGHEPAYSAWGLSERDWNRFLALRGRPPCCVECAARRDAMSVWCSLYWVPGQCDDLPYPVAVLHLSHAIHTGLPSAHRTLRRALRERAGEDPYGVPERSLEGSLSAQEIASIATLEPADLLAAYYRHHGAWLDAIALRDPHAGKERGIWHAGIEKLRVLLGASEVVASSPEETEALLAAA